MLKFSAPNTSTFWPLPYAKQDVAQFLLIRGPYVSPTLQPHCFDRMLFFFLARRRVGEMESPYTQGSKTHAKKARRPGSVGPFAISGTRV
jgi:hypothetical protein